MRSRERGYDSWLDTAAHMTLGKLCTPYVPLSPSNMISFGLERLGLEAVSRRSRDVFWNVSVSRVWKNRTSRSRLGLEDITSRSRSRDFSLVNIHAMHQACEYITKKIMDHDPQEAGCQVTDFTSWCFRLRHCGLDTFFGTSRSRLGLVT